MLVQQKKMSKKTKWMLLGALRSLQQTDERKRAAIRLGLHVSSGFPIADKLLLVDSF